MKTPTSTFLLFLFFLTLVGCFSDFVSETEPPTGRTVNGQKQGEWRTYYKTGILYKTEQYLNDTLNGPSIIYSEEGDVYTRVRYKNGILVDSFIHYYSDGKPNYLQLRDSGGNLESTRVYFPNGELKCLFRSLFHPYSGASFHPPWG